MTVVDINRANGHGAGYIEAGYYLVPQRETVRIVLAHGCFDLLHLGHIRHLQQAKSWGDILLVSVTDDKHVAKGLGRPHFTAAQRVEALKALGCVDDAFVNPDPDPFNLIRKLRPTIYVKGIDYEDPNHPGHQVDKAVCDEVGTEFRTTTTDKWSSSRLITEEKFSADVLSYLDSARRHDFLSQILNAFEAADKLKIAFVGERIIDEYRYVRAIGKSAKEFSLASVETGQERFNGGVVAGAKHADWQNTAVVSSADTICKTRYVDADFSRKLFEIYSQQQLSISPPERLEFSYRLREAINGSDVIVVLDFGHGLLSDVDRKELQKAKFLAINAQTNAGNHGYNLVTRYKKADLICIDDPEARLAAGCLSEPIDQVASKLSEHIDCPRFLITHGRNGSFFYGKRWGSAPAFVTNGIDTIGAGDAVMATVAPLIAAGLDLEAAALVGNVVGALKVSILGHRRHVGRQEIIATLESLLR